MTTRLVDRNWGAEIEAGAKIGADQLIIICPFIKSGAIERILSGRSKSICVITRFNLNDFASGVSDLLAIQTLISAGAEIRGVKNLHAKMYVFGNRRAIVTSANLTQMGLDRNVEFGLISDEENIISACSDYFRKLRNQCGTSISQTTVRSWGSTINRHLISGAPPDRQNELGDYGVELANLDTMPIAPPSVAEASQYFIKFFGKSNNRASLDWPVLEEVKRSGCHWALSYPTSKRPKNVRDNAVLFIARLTCNPNDLRIIGRCIGLRYQEGRDDATVEDLNIRPWKEHWSRYIRVHHAEFVAGTIRNGVSMQQLMTELQSDSFAATQRNAINNVGNVDPRRAYLRKAAIELSRQGFEWVNDCLQSAFVKYGKIPADDLANIDWPLIPHM